MIRPSFFKTIRLLLFLTLFPMAGLLASSESYVQMLTGHLKKGDSLTVIDDKFLNLPLNQWNQLKHISVDNIISFELRQDTTFNYYNKAFSCTLNVTIKYFTSRDQQTPKEIDNVDLVVKYDTTRGKSYPLVARYKFKDAFKVTVVINSISSPEWKDKLPDVFLLKNQILVERKYPFDPHKKGSLLLGELQLTGQSDQLVAGGPQAPQTPPPAPGLQVINETLPISWDASAFGGAEEYDVEWTYIDILSGRGLAINNNYGGPNGPFTIPDNTAGQWMLHDNTRVTVTGGSYTINLPYTEGFVLVRIRGVSCQSGTNLRLTGDWSYLDDQGHAACVYIPAHQPNLSWQYNGSFAEEGKRKEVITYFDGSLRNRQSVTINNSDNTYQNGVLSTTGTAVVQETIYDVMGRPAMNILPAPVKNNVIDYYPSFNLNDKSSAPYSAADISLANPNSCVLLADKLSVSSGAAQYYSPGNTFLDAQNAVNYYFTKYVPDAQQYPYALTEYTQDNTGRIRRQGGVGQTLQIGNGHETNYYYGKPTSTELERLFGMEAGNSSHYLKNMVVDPNGQASVSYIDANGKTVATALAGRQIPSSLDPLPSALATGASMQFNETLIKPADFSPNSAALNMTASSTFLAEVTGTFTLNYSINPLALVTNYGTGGGSQLCNNCYYAVNVQVTNDCGQVVSSAASTPFQGNDYTCYVNPPPVTQSLGIPINKLGEYTVTYSLQLSSDVINAQTNYYVQNNTDLKKLQDFFIQELQNLDLSGCYTTCDACKSLGTSVDDFKSKITTLLGSDAFTGVTVGDANSPVSLWINQTWTALKARCNTLSCAPASPCDQKLSQLKADVLPGGQYALYDATALANGSTSVFLETQINVMVYYTTDNAISSLTFIASDGTTKTVGSLNQADFVNAYLKHPEWADLFVIHHIEYCSYLWCKDASNPTPAKNNEVSNIFDEGLKENYKDGADAVNAGYYNHQDPLALLNNDPFFNGGWGSGFFSNMQSDLQNLSTVLSFAPVDNTATPLPGKNIIQLIDWMLYCKPSAPNPTAAQVIASWQNCTPADNCRSVTMEWQLYMNYYLQLKGKYYQMAKLQTQHYPTCLDCFIGSDVLATSGCPPPGALTDYSVVERVENNSYNFYIVYKNGTAPFSGDYTFSYDQWSTSLDGNTLAVPATTLTAHAGDMQVLISAHPEPLGVVYDLGGYYEVLGVACTPSSVASCAASSSDTPPAGACPDISSFGYLLGSKDSHVADPVWLPNLTNWTQNVYYAYSGGAVTRPITVSVTETVQTITATQQLDGSTVEVQSDPVTGPPGTLTINPGQSNVLLGTNYENYLVYLPGDGSGSTPPSGNHPGINVYYNYVKVTWQVAGISCPDYTPPPSAPASTCTSNPNYALYQYKNRVFNDYTNVQAYISCNAANTTTSAQATTALLQAAIADLSTQQATWLSMLTSVRDQEFPALSSSTLSDAVLANLVSNLGQVSAAYLQYASQQGLAMNTVSSLPSGVTGANGYTSFGDVFNAIVGSSLVAQGFSADLLSNVYPYNKVPYATDPNVTSLTPDIFMNVGNNLSVFQSAWNGGPGTFGAYLQQQLGDDYFLTDAQLSDLQSRVSGGCTNPYLAGPAILPVSFVVPKPDGNNNFAYSYATCSQISTLSANFTTAYPSVPVDTKLYRLLYTNYLNHQLGYPLSYADYVNFTTKCPTNSSALLYDKPQSPTLLYDYFACTASLLNGVYTKSGQEYDLYINQVRVAFRNAYISKCLSNQASANVQGTQYEYHYTLYYYDQSGNLVKTIPPEGVRLLTDQQIAEVEQLPAQDASSCAAFPNVVTDQPTILNDLSAGLQDNSALSMEMWLYSSSGTATRQLRMVTPDNKYMYQVAIANKMIWVELYTLQPDASGTGIDMTLTNQAVANLSPQLPLLNWTHLVIQSPGGLTGGSMQVYVDGNLLTLIPDPSAASYPFPWEINGGFTLPQADLSIIRHLRLYNRVMTDPEIAADFQNSCLSPVDALTGSALKVWGRLNIPSFCNNNTGSASAITVPDKGSLTVTANPDPTGVLGTHVFSNVTNTFTVEFWVNPQTPLNVNPDELPNTFTGVDDSPPYAIFPLFGGSISSGIANMGVAVGTDGVAVFEHADHYLPALLIWKGAVSGWTHVAIVYNNLTPSLYINGVYQATGNTSTKTSVSPCYNFGGGSYGNMTGGLDEVRIWSVARTASQLSTAYTQALPSTDQQGLVGYWPMDNTSGSTIHDVSCGNNDISLITPAENWATTGAPLTETNLVEFAGRFIVPDHGLPTNYAYNSLNQVVQQQTPDAGTSVFLYDRLGRLSISQNAEQLQPAVVDDNNPAGRFSYTRYDALGRITEVGEKLGAATLAETDTRNDATLQSWFGTGSNRQVTVTAYDQQPSWAPAGLLQDNLRKRVAASALLTAGSDPTQNRQAASYYNYDIDGNVAELVQENADLKSAEQQNIPSSDGLQHIQYEYDLISGKVNKVRYQDGKWDQFYYQYVYDADNRIIKAYSSRTNDADVNLWTNEATYRYYLHGPLARMELGENKVQGLDYAYTLQGWLKGVNGQQLTVNAGPQTDMSGNSAPGSPFSGVARNVLGYGLGYYANDYQPIGGVTAPAFSNLYQAPAVTSTETGKELFNGNISHASYAMTGLGTYAGLTTGFTGYSYRYDQLNRLTAMDQHVVSPYASATNWSNSSIVTAYGEQISYDANGNIQTYRRNGSSAQTAMDQLTYNYNRDGSGNLLNNKLRHINDAVPDGNYSTDIDNQSSDNYTYDNIGNLKGDNQGGVSGIQWTVYGKIASLSYKSNLPNSGIIYTYDASGNRIGKNLYSFIGSGNGEAGHLPMGTFNNTFYVRDAQGNVLGVYAYSKPSLILEGTTGNGLVWTEQHLYGSSRLGIISTTLQMQAWPTDAYQPTNTFDNTTAAGIRQYEITNHLGNVMTTISDVKIGIPSPGNSSLIDHYEPTVVSAQDFYPFGMLMPGRTYAGGSYRYGFNGKEQDPEVKGVGNQYDYGFRIYDPRIGRFLSVDPLRARYPWNSTYCFAENDMIRAIDLDGAEHKIVIHWIDKKYEDGALHIAKTSVNINQNESFDGWGRSSTASKSSGSVYALTETYYYMMGENKLYKGKDLLENANVNSVNPPPSAQYDYGPNVMEDKAADDAKWAGWNPLKWTRLIIRDATAPDNAKTVEDVNMGMLAFSSVVGAPSMLRGMLKAENVAVNGVNNSAFTEKNISIVTEHLKQFGDKAENKIMLERMNDILNGKLEATEIDKNFIAHELREQELEAGGMNHDAAHEQVLKEQNMYHREYEKKLYTKEAIDAGNEQMLKESINK